MSQLGVVNVSYHEASRQQYLVVPLLPVVREIYLENGLIAREIFHTEAWIHERQFCSTPPCTGV